jgi:CubicO group peptidase (beta-lactamase class C family)
VTAPAIDGHVAAGWDGLAREFATNLGERGDVGAAVAVYHRGSCVVDLWGGFTDAARQHPWHADTIVGVFSTTKGVTAVCANLLIERGVLDPDEPVSTYWPEFAANGKAEIPLRWLLSHRAGVAALDAPVTMEDVLGWDGVVAAVAAQAPNWEPGTMHGYHARTYGWAVGEVIRRVTGMSAGTFFRHEVGDPLGLRFWIGLPDEEESHCADLIPAPGPGFMDLFSEDSMFRRVMAGPNDLFVAGYDESWNDRSRRAAEMPSSNGIGDARSLARMYAATIGSVDGIRLLSAGAVSRATEVQSEGPECVVGIPMTIGLGFMVGPTMCPTIGDRAFGHAGAGGSLAFADPDAEIGFAYVMNQLAFDPEDRRASSLAAAARRCAGGGD